MREVARMTRGQMSAGEAAFHWLMIFGTCGFWYPVYSYRKHKKARTVHYYAA